VIRDFFLGFIKIHVLHHAAEHPVYGAWMMEELHEHGYDLSPGTLYPILHGLEGEGLLAVEERVVDGKRRKYYSATEAGREVLLEAKTKIRELTEEVLEAKPQASAGPVGRRPAREDDSQ
jgi:PadR family transcriptional regulator PadR